MRMLIRAGAKDMPELAIGKSLDSDDHDCVTLVIRFLTFKKTALLCLETSNERIPPGFVVSMRLGKHTTIRMIWF